MRVTFLYNALTDCRVPMVAEAISAPDGRLFLVYQNHGATARGLFLDMKNVPPAALRGDAAGFHAGVIGPGSFKEYPAAETGHTEDTPEARPQE
jgi:hypothetical protein